VDGRMTVHDIIDECRMGEFETTKALYSLLSLGLIGKVGEAAKPVIVEGRQKRPVDVRSLLVAFVTVTTLVVVAVVNPLGLYRARDAGVSARAGAAAIGEAQRREKVRFALLCHTLEKGTYPVALAELVTGRYLRAGDILDRQGKEFSYLREESGYSLRSAGGR
jgi:hypothetical protein